MKSKKQKKNQSESPSKMMAIIRIRGEVGIKPKIRDTLSKLRLHHKNYCVVVPNTASYMGMISVVKDYVTFGEINPETFKTLFEKRARIVGNKPITDTYIKDKLKTSVSDFSNDFMAFKTQLKDIPGVKPFFRLHPPVGGFERKGIKKPYSIGGALGYRKEKINDLIIKML